MFDVISIGSSLVDIFVHSDKFELQKTQEGVLLCQKFGDKVEADEFNVHTGGGGSNTAVGFARLGFRTGLVTELGQDVFSGVILDELHREVVADTLVIREKTEKTGGSVILIGQNGGRTVLVHRGAASQLNPTDLPTRYINLATWLHLSSISGQLDTLQHFFDLAKQANKPFSWNPGKSELKLITSGQLSIAYYPRILFVNQEEWDFLADVQPVLTDNIPLIFITAGAAGGIVVEDGQKARRFQVPAVQSVDDTGAGDAFACGVVAGILWNWPLDNCLSLGIANAQSVIKQIGAKSGLLRKSEVESQALKLVE